MGPAMVHVVLGSGLAQTGATTVQAMTVGELLPRLLDQEPWLAEIDEDELRIFVRGQEASTMAGQDTPVDEEDTVLITTW